MPAKKKAAKKKVAAVKPADPPPSLKPLEKILAAISPVLTPGDEDIAKAVEELYQEQPDALVAILPDYAGMPISRALLTEMRHRVATGAPRPKGKANKSFKDRFKK